MAEVVNLNRARKAKARAEDRARADANRIAFGQTKAQKQTAAMNAERRQRALDGAKREA